MTEQEWDACDNAFLMLNYIWRFNKIPQLPFSFGGNMNHIIDSSVQLHRYYLACCRAIWPLLPQELSRQGIELAEQWLDGKVSTEALNQFNYCVEGAAFNIDYNTEPDKIETWIRHLQLNNSYRNLLHPPEMADQLSLREILRRAAYFADYAMIYPSLEPIGTPNETYRLFLSAPLLRHFVSFKDTLNEGEE